MVHGLHYYTIFLLLEILQFIKLAKNFLDICHYKYFIMGGKYIYIFKELYCIF